MYHMYINQFVESLQYIVSGLARFETRVGVRPIEDED